MFMSQSVSADLSDDLREEMIKEIREYNKLPPLL
jgi:hypothetical protein